MKRRIHVACIALATLVMLTLLACSQASNPNGSTDPTVPPGTTPETPETPTVPEDQLGTIRYLSIVTPPIKTVYFKGETKLRPFVNTLFPAV